MGALGGHMNHLWEDLGVTFGELREIFSDAVSGDLECFEKADGINMFFTVDSRGNTRFARNSTEIKNLKHNIINIITLIIKLKLDLHLIEL